MPNSSAGYDLAQCEAHNGDLKSAIAWYHGEVYTDDPARPTPVSGYAFKTNDIPRLIEFALLLNKTGQGPEACYAYNHAADNFNYVDGHPYHETMVPKFGTDPGEVPYDPRLLTAMADVVIGQYKTGFDNIKAQAYLEEATRLAPTSAAAWFYLARVYPRCTSQAQMELYKTAMQKAIALSGSDLGLQAAATREFTGYYHPVYVPAPLNPVKHVDQPAMAVPPAHPVP